MKRPLALLLCLVMCVTLIPSAAAGDIEIVEIEPEDGLIALVDEEESAVEAVSGAKPTITASPKSVTAYVGTTVTFTVEAIDAESYQWYFRTSAEGSWKENTSASAATAALSVVASGFRSGYQYYCKVRNSAGTSYTKAVTLTVSMKPVVTAQPESLSIVTGGTARFSVKADGAASYQWYWRANKDDSWHKGTLSTASTATLVYKNMSSIKDGYQFKCKVSNDEGYVYSSVATLYVSRKPVVTAQPESLTIGAGGTARFTVAAEGATGYQWFWRAGADDSWHKSTLSSAAEATLICENMAVSKSGRQYKCKVSSAEGYTYSKIATLTVSAEKPSVTAQPLSCTAGAGAKVKFKVEASGANSYQWQYRTSSSGSWSSSSLSGSRTDTLTVSATMARSGYEYRCVLKNANGTSYSKKAVLTVSDKQCGDDLTWTLDSGGLLTISGTGEMYGLGSDDFLEAFRQDDEVELYQPWEYLVVRRVVIEDGVTDIGDYAFFECDKLTDVSIGSGVAEIGSYSFLGCVELKNVTIPEGVTDVEIGAFIGCSSLTGMAIPDSVTWMGDNVFFNCSSLTDMTIGSGLDEYCVRKAVIGCGALTRLSVSADNPYCMSVDNVVFNREKTSLYACAPGRSGSYSIPAGVMEIDQYAFRGCGALTDVTIPDSVTEIGQDAFSGCSSLTSMSIPAGVTVISNGLFYYCESLTRVSIPESVTIIDIGAFCGCSSLTGITIPASVKTIGKYAFENCSSLTSVTIPEGVKKIGYRAFCNCGSLTCVTLPNSVTSIQDDAFAYCGSLASVTIGSGVKSIGSRAFYNCSALTDVYYRGTKTQWNKIDIGSDNNPLLKATMHYNA